MLDAAPRWEKPSNKSYNPTLKAVKKHNINILKYTTFMKTPKLLMGIVAIFLFTNILFAGNPKTIVNADDFANKRVTLLSTNIALTDSQKLILIAKSKTFAQKIQNADSLSSSKKMPSLINASREYNAIIDSVLTPSQKTQLAAKRNAEREAILAKIKSTNK